MCTYLAKRGSIYYFRRVIPVELRSAFGGKREFMETLGTKDRAEAKRLIPARTSASERELQNAQVRLASPPNASVSPSTSISVRVGRRELEHLEWLEENTAFQEQIDDEREELEEALEPASSAMKARLQAPLGTLDPSDAAVKLMLMERDDEVASLKARLAIIDVQSLDPIPVSNDAQGVASASGSLVTSSTVFLSPDIINLWASERSVQLKTKEASAAVVRWFYECVGRIAVSDITRKDVLAFKDKLVADGQGSANINTKLSRLRTLLQWAHDNDYAASNVAQSIKVKDGGSPADRRKPFDLAALNAVFGSPVFKAGYRPVQGRGEAAYWLPLLALFTGARMEELGQLRNSDVREISFPDASGTMQSAWFLDITADADEGLRLKTASSERSVPIHATLIDLGFLGYIAHVKAAGHVRAFPDLKPGAYGRLTAKWGEWFGRYRKIDCGITDDRMVFHSFRHTFKDYCRAAKIEEGVQRQLMGHAKGDVADSYGSGYPAHRLVEAMQSYRVPGLKLPTPLEFIGAQPAS